ncbi:M23 family metallopeptidase [Chthonobacter rhizosphaerae]|uniref:M23 family metallopeptidase n=1 Tax=Chthonobacter rhizosphaerae TaxID=2735553 RepID=UPI0015EFC2BE|nr:M23 family metallopeptidase [Chthonobacter rhizosphaerae]
MNAVWNDHASVDIDLGDEPALVTADNRSGPPDRRRVSLRWLTGTVLAAMASTSLMGGALFVAMDGRQTFAVPVGAAMAAVPQGAEQPTDLMPKGDRLIADAGPAPTRQVLRVSTISRDGDRDLIRLRPFARVSAPLVASAADIGEEIPKFDPLRIFADANVDTKDGMPDTLYGADVDGQMTLKVTDFPVGDPAMDAASPLDVAATEEKVRDAAQFNGPNVQEASLQMVDPARFEFGFAERSAFEQYGVRIFSENVSFIGSTEETGAAVGNTYTEEKTVVVQKGDDLMQTLIANEATDEEAAEIALRFRKDFNVLAAEPGDRLRVVLAPVNDESGRYQPIRTSLYRDGNHIGTVALSDHAGYVAAEEPRTGDGDAFQMAGEPKEDAEVARPRLYDSLYQTALANQMSPDLIDELVRIYSFDMDFNTRVGPGDQIEVVYSLDEDESESRDASEIVFTAITIDGKTHRYYRYKAPDDGSIDYYDEAGKSAKKFLLRKPVSGGTFRSGFGSRRHPLLGYVRRHTGVDWAAPRGTPIMSAGNGTIAYADWKSGYGNYIVVKHANGYETAYGHMSGFAKGMKKGMKVRQGQVIGYVGSTGLSTGPHLHYEVLVNENYVDPMRIKLPQGRTLDGSVLTSFEQERERIDTLLGVGPPAKLASAGSSGGG